MDFKPLIKSFQQMGEEFYGDPAYGDKVVEDLSKALTLGSYPTTAGTTTTDSGPLRLQNLDPVMTSVLFTEQHIKLWNFLTKVPSAQPYYEWNRRRGYGSSRGSSGFAEGGAPSGSVASYERQGAYTKFMGVRRGITHQLTLTGQLGGTQIDPVAEENRNGTMELLEKIERQLWFGDATITNEAAQSVNYDGILKQAKGTLGDSTKVVDKGGAAMQFIDFENAGEDLYTTGFVSNFSDLHCFMTPNILADLSARKFQGAVGAQNTPVGEAVDRRLLGQMQDGYVTGLPLTGHQTNFGRINFDPWIFGQRVKGDKPLTTADPNAPATPAAPTGAANSSVTGSKFTAAYTVAYYYTIAAFNDKGESATSVTASSTTPGGASGGSVTITFPAAIPATTTGWRVYRGTKSDSSDAKWIADVPTIGASAATTYEDKNFKIPGTGYVALLNKSPEVLTIAQMTPLIRFPLAIVSTTIEWLLLLYHVPILKAGERIYIWENVGRLT